MKNILICVDKNPLNSAVCEYGFNMAKNLNAKVTLLQVIKTPLFTPNFLGLAAGGLVLTQGSDMAHNLDELKPTKEQIDEADEILKNAKKLALEFGLEDVSTELQNGDLIEILINYENADAIVVAIKDESEEIANNIIALTRETNTPILFVNENFKEINSILLAYDGAENSKKALETIKTTKILGENLEYHIANVSDDVKKSEEILNSAREILKGENAKFITLSGNPAEELIKYRRSHNLDIYALGSYTKGIFATLLFGSTSKNIVQNALVPVFVIG